MEELNLKISASPHVRSKNTTSDIMFDVILALIPATVFGIYYFGWYSLAVIAVCILSAVAAEAIYQKCMHKSVTIGDFSAVLTGLLLALNLPPEFPLWMAAIGSVFAIIVVKQLFGGLGQNFMNPALAARCFLVLSFGSYMTRFVVDGVATATPLAMLRQGMTVDLKDMFMGYTAGTIGETSTVALLVGAIYLLVKKVISPKIPVIYIGTFAICIAIYGATKNYDVVQYTAAHLCGGGLMLGAWFMATDYVTSPITSTGKIIFGVILGLLTFVFRIFGGTPEGVSYAIIISNLLVPLIEKVTAPKPFGYGADKKGNTEKKEDKPEDEKSVKDDGAVEKKSKFHIKSILNAVVVLFVITLVMGAGLGVVYDITKEPIEKAQEQAKIEAAKKAYPLAATIKTSDEINYDEINSLMGQAGVTMATLDELSIALDSSGNPLGYIVTVTSPEGYGGDIQLMLGVSMEGVIQGMDFLTINETVGFGLNAKEPEFLNQFVGKQVTEIEYTKTGATSENQIDAISGATITTSAVVDCVNYALIIVQLMGGAQ